MNSEEPTRSVDELWRDSYEGEVYGELIFRRAAERQSAPTRRHQLEVLALLERKTRELAEPIMAARKITIDDVTSGAEERAGTVAAYSWEEFLAWLERVTDRYVPLYKQLVELCSDAGERAVAQAYVAHEEALASYGRRVSGREEGDPLGPVLALDHMAGVSVGGST